MGPGAFAFQKGSIMIAAARPRALPAWTDNLPQAEDSLQTSPTAKMDLLHAQLDEAGHPCTRMTWRLLFLEWRYDYAVLFGNVHAWMSYIDRRFSQEKD